LHPARRYASTAATSHRLIDDLAIRGGGVQLLVAVYLLLLGLVGMFIPCEGAATVIWGVPDCIAGMAPLEQWFEGTTPLAVTVLGLALAAYGVHRVIRPAKS
jgi:hypothetical protein